MKAPRSLGSEERLELVFDVAKKQQNNQEDGYAVEYDMTQEFREPIDSPYHSKEEEYERQVPSLHSASTAETDNRTGSIVAPLSRTLTSESDMRYGYNVPDQHYFPAKDEPNENDVSHPLDNYYVSGFNAITADRSLSNDKECNSETAATTDAAPSKIDVLLGAAVDANDLKQQQLEPGESTSSASSVGWKVISSLSTKQNKAQPNPTMSIASESVSDRNNSDKDIDKDRVLPQQEQQRQQQQEEEEEVTSSVNDEGASAAVLSSIEVARVSHSIISDVTPYSGSFLPVYDAYNGGRTSYQAHLQQPHAVGGSTSHDEACRSTTALDGYVESKSNSRGGWFKKIRRKKKGGKTQDINDRKEGVKATAMFLRGSSKRQESKPISKRKQSRQSAQERVQDAPPLLDIVARKRAPYNSAQNQEHLTDYQDPPLVDIFARIRTPSQRTPSENLSGLKVVGGGNVRGNSSSQKISISDLSNIYDLPSSGKINSQRREWKEHDEQQGGCQYLSFLCMVDKE